ncbi:Ubiquilin-1 [Zancudomyces culisetae]|uniref:Ubiquilin-1 n=1 Tax=Zancudomyces culisetae TaxID=1213189 RepID=A0A1R1PGL4_ZANCU|nr:Ubiquilin-1 [Zancudomyces culisetae]OMH81610.1 Ubiquilin-1 [Zancudomyces culisetae]|eukprot:OMH79992.1 Ubiquilin-1 [Zancudomyces culisetae]
MSISSLQSISTPQPNTPTFAQNSGSAEPGNSSSSSLKPTNFSNTDTRTESKESRFSRYQSQIQLLSEMGFPNKERNLEALEVTNGDLYLAVEYLARKP